MIRYSYEMHGTKGAKRVTVEIDRPDWWEDATARERAPLEAAALDSDAVQFAIGAGYRISNVIRPVCACIVQAVEHRDPYWAGANGSCRRCGGPLKKKGKRRNG